MGESAGAEGGFVFGEESVLAAMDALREGSAVLMAERTLVADGAAVRAWPHTYIIYNICV